MNGMLPPAAGARKRRLRIRNGMGRETPRLAQEWARRTLGPLQGLLSRQGCSCPLGAELGLRVPTRAIRLAFAECLYAPIGNGTATLLIERIKQSGVSD